MTYNAIFKIILLFAILLPKVYFLNAQTKIIDMHVHSYDSFQFKNQVKDYYGKPGALNSNQHFFETYEAF